MCMRCILTSINQKDDLEDVGKFTIDLGLCQHYLFLGIRQSP